MFISQEYRHYFQHYSRLREPRFHGDDSTNISRAQLDAHRGDAYISPSWEIETLLLKGKFIRSWVHTKGELLHTDYLVVACAPVHVDGVTAACVHVLVYTDMYKYIMYVRTLLAHANYTGIEPE